MRCKEKKRNDLHAQLQVEIHQVSLGDRRKTGRVLRGLGARSNK